MDFADEMLEDAVDYNLENLADLDADDDLIALEEELRLAIGSDPALALELAREVRRYLIANGYADDDELAKED